MKLVQIKTARELKLPGTHIEFVTEGDSLKEVIFRPEGEEETYSIKPGTSYSDTVRVFLRREYEVKEVHRVTGNFFDVNVSQDFDTPKEASDKVNSMTSRDANAELKITPVKVRVDEAGEPIKNAPLNDDIPF